VALEIQQPALCSLPVTALCRISVADERTDRAVLRIIERLVEMIPLELSDVVCSDSAMTLLIALAVSTCKLGCDVARHAGHDRWTHVRLTPASRLGMAGAAQRSQADTAVLPGASRHFRGELSWAQSTRLGDLRRDTTRQS
jgi:hypothetical protein